MGGLTLIFEHFAVVVGVLIAALSVILVLTQRRSPQSAAAWLLSIVLVPYVAVPVFLALGFRKQGRGYPSIAFSELPVREPVENPVAAVFRCLGAPPAVGGNRLDLHDSPQAARAALDAVVEGATERLDVLFYIVERDDCGQSFVRSLADRARAGVKVRVLLDRMGTLTRPFAELAALREAGGEVLFFSPFLNWPNRGHMNLRNHRKMVIADRASVWSGGRNVGNPYLAEGGWTDLSFTVVGPSVQSFVDVFETNWTITSGDSPDPAAARSQAVGTAQLQLIAAGPDDSADTLHTGLVQAIHAARRRVWIATPYYVPTEFLSQAIVTAARRGVDVRVMVPDKSNKKITDFARGAYLRDLARHGGTVLRVPSRMVHAKMGVIDDAAWVGTANFDVRSMLLNFETVLFAYDTETVDQLSGWFDGIASEAEVGARPVWLLHRVLEGLFRLGSPIL